MNFVLNIDQFNIDCVKFMDTKKNIIMNGDFTKIIYSDNLITLNGIYINCIMNERNFTKKIIELENTLIEYYKYRIGDGIKSCLFNETISSQLITPFRNCDRVNKWSNETQPIILKISGIWENNNQIGLTYKFIEMYELT